MSNRGFLPEWISAPGETIADVLSQKRMRLEHFAEEMSCSVDQATQLLNGTAGITREIAIRLSSIVGSSESFWLRREQQYREDLARLEVSTSYETDYEWLEDLPVRDMVHFGWIDASVSKKARLRACLDFFGVSDRDEWQRRYSQALGPTVAFRHSKSFASDGGAMVAWLRQGELECQRIVCADWNSDRFRKTLPEIRRLTRSRHPSHFIAELQELCARAGVAVAVVRAPAGCRASGVTRFLTESKAMLVLSGRYLSDDQFWFTFFHEAGHLLLHGPHTTFLEGMRMESNEEEEADEFAANTLIPEETRAELSSVRARAREIIKVAMRLGVSPGIVVGQMQHAGQLRYSQLNALKRRFEWSSPEKE